MRKTLISSFVLLVSAGVGLTVRAGEPNVYRDVSRHYETIRLALLADSLEGVAEHALSLRESVETLADGFDVLKAGVAEDKAEACKKLLTEIAAAAQKVAKGSALGEVRASFFELSKPIGRYRKLTDDLDTQVLFCPMAKKAWIQPRSEIGNPYLGSEMPTCGEVVAD